MATLNPAHSLDHAQPAVEQQVDDWLEPVLVFATAGLFCFTLLAELIFSR